MNDYRLLNAVSVHLSSFELEQLLELELAKLGLEQFVLMIIDVHQRPVFQHVCGFSHKQMKVYEQNMAHDVFFHHYANHGYLGKLLYMQDMLPMRKIQNPVFNEILVPTMQLYHSYSGLAPLMNNHYVMLSSHSERSLSYRAEERVGSIWQFLVAWGNSWVAQSMMMAQLSQFDSITTKDLPLISLTSAELNVLNLLAQGLDGSEVAQQRNVSKETVRSQIKQILHKTGCRHQNQLLACYFQSGPQSSSQFMTLSPQLTDLI
ncbi:LuxR C-terminal-related transcriptional regulator [Vibrio alginolyticus]|uniref:helix-turn-helix transcriptional regulator n=1 Tax=Vibrio alginolyticus TaxID=663 RepID=UPI001EECB4D0|nr:LuxR C-terminal-related transcriptional regulator [Vibrio alginolyticus]MCG6308534.1 LuxR C-terminal-related transcriptional regulator [Vibrio alginolyticus]